MQQLNGIIFDWDGVLVESLDFIQEAFDFTLKEVAPGITIEHNTLPALSLRNYFPILFGKDAPRAEEVFYDYVEKNHLKSLKSTPGADSLLQALQEQGIPLFIVSNKKGELLRKEVDYLSWTSYFKGIVGAGDCEEDKPSSVPVQHVLGLEGLSADKNVWFIGDTDVDMECASRSNCLSVLMRTEKKCLNNKDIPADMVVGSCEDLKAKVINNKM
jgi:phosphoglycolate phosphatase